MPLCRTVLSNDIPIVHGIITVFSDKDIYEDGTMA